MYICFTILCKLKFYFIYFIEVNFSATRKDFAKQIFRWLLGKDNYKIIKRKAFDQ